MCERICFGRHFYVLTRTSTRKFRNLRFEAKSIEATAFASSLRIHAVDLANPVVIKGAISFWIRNLFTSIIREYRENKLIPE